MLLGSFGRSHSLVDGIGLTCEIQKVRECKALPSQLVAGAWKAQVHEVGYAWRVFCYSCTPTHSLADRFTSWRAAERFFIEFFGFLFDNTSACYLVFAFFFPTLLTFILLLWFDKYCKVEFIQSFCWLYSVPNLYVIQHLETLYLGGNHVRVVCERLWRKAQEYALKKSVATTSHD